MSNEPIYRQVIRDVEARAEVGKKTYGRYLMADVNGRDPVQDAYEEALDMAHYLKQVSHDRLALIEYVARLEGALAPFGGGSVIESIKNGDFTIMRERIVDWFSPSDFRNAANVLAGSPLSGQPQPAPATGWRPIAEAPKGQWLFVGKRVLKEWYRATMQKPWAIANGYTHYLPEPEPPAREVSNDRG